MVRKTSEKEARDKIAKMKLPVAKLLPSSMFLKTSNLKVEGRKLNEIAELLWRPSGLKPEDQNARIQRAIELYESLKPADGLEGMLAVQMVGTHHAALECLRRAAVPNQSFGVRDMSLKHAQKLMVLYAQQVAALDKHRGKGQQQVTVKYVNVAAGGQAIVGNVEHGSRLPEATAPEPAKAIEAAVTIAPTPAPAPARVRRKKPED
ncbi:MAG: hypothetical protein K0B00_08250 [Rhodobacteraceae bacterium]|nr:hypothetical protein [Paracoccaceae bacterium]